MTNSDYAQISIGTIENLKLSISTLSRDLGVAFSHNKEYQEYRDYLDDVYCRLSEIKYRCEIIKEEKK